MKIVEQDACPACGVPTVAVDRGLPWCPSCRWNLDRYDPAGRRRRGPKWLDRRGFATAFRLGDSLLTRYSGRPPAALGWTRGRIVLVAVAVALLVIALGCLVGGIVLLATAATFLPLMVGVLLVLVALVFRPRLGRTPRRRRRATATQTPALYAMIAAVAEVAGTRAPDHIVPFAGYNAAVGQSGLRRTRTLYLGTSLWVTLDPPMRLAVLGHEFGHYVNGDPNRNLLVQPVLATFGRLASWTGADQTLDDVVEGQRRTIPLRMLLLVLSRIFLAIHLGLTAIGFRDHQRAEVLADAVAVRVAGRDGATRLERRFSVDDQVQRLIRYGAETLPPWQWRATIEHYERTHPKEIVVGAQLSRRRVSLWDTHPPVGVRLQLIESWDDAGPALDPAAFDWAAIDAELAPWYRAMHEQVLGTRDYRPAPPSTRPTPTRDHTIAVVDRRPWRSFDQAASETDPD